MIAKTKEKHDARVLFFRAKRVMGKQPKTMAYPNTERNKRQKYDRKL